MAAGQYVRALFDFHTTVYGEISLLTGDVVLLLYTVDDNWVCGKLRGQVSSNDVTEFLIGCESD